MYWLGVVGSVDVGVVCAGDEGGRTIHPANSVKVARVASATYVSLLRVLMSSDYSNCGRSGGKARREAFWFRRVL